MTVLSESGRFRIGVPAIVLVLVLALGGCGRHAPAPRQLAACGNHLVVGDFRQVALLEYESQRNVLAQHDAVNLPASVIGQGLLHCATGGFVYETTSRMSTSVTSVLHLRARGRETRLEFKEGINSILPLGTTQLLVHTKVVRHSPMDPSLGELSMEESRPALPLALQSAPPSASGVAGTGQHLYMADVVVDAITGRRIRTVKGNLSPHLLQDGRVISHSINGEVFELDPATGRRKRIHSYQVADKRWGVPVNSVAHGAAKYYVHGDHLYVVTAAPDPRPDPGPRLLPNSVLRFDVQAGAWMPLAQFDFPGQAFAKSGDELVVVGAGRIAAFHIPSGRLRHGVFGPSGLEPVSVAAIDDGWVIALSASRSPGSDVEPTQLLVMASDFSKVVLRHPLAGMGPVRLSTSRTPIHEW